jgi:hypothetical protein
MAHLLDLNSFKGKCLKDNWIRISKQLCADQSHSFILGHIFNTDNCLRQAEKETDVSRSTYGLINFHLFRLYNVERKAEDHEL